MGQEAGQPQDLKALVMSAQGGDLAAYGQLIRRFQNMAYGFCYSVLLDFQLAEDATQEAFFEAFRQLPTLCEPLGFPAWLRRILVKHCDRLQRSRRAGKCDPLAEDAAIASRELQPPELADQREMKEAVLDAVRQLPEAERLVTTLFYIDGFSQQQIAEFLEVPEGTVKSRLHASRSRLRERITQMVEQALRSSPLPQRFADVLVEMRFVSERVEPLASRMMALSDAEMTQRRESIGQRMGGADREMSLAEGLALVREATRRACGLVHYPVQLVAAMFLERGWVAEVPAGEGKGLTIIAAAGIAAMQGRKVHVMVPNDYLAIRDGKLAREVLQRVGVSVGWITATTPLEQRQGAYRNDIVYATAVEFGFDRLREPAMALDVAIIDEADNLLIDQPEMRLVLAKGETEKAPDRTRTPHRAPSLERDRDYLVIDGHVRPVDPVIGRAIPGWLWADGVQRTIEARESVAITPVAEAAASITLREVFTSYAKLAGITGTAMHRADLLREGYGLEAVAVPTHRDSRLIEHPDRVYRSDAERCEAVIVEAIHYARDLGRPVLIATTSIPQNRKMAELLRESGIEHEVLDARPECMAREGEILAKAGRRARRPDVAAITVGTAMAGRGADITLSGEDTGGLHVIGVGRHAIRRVDQQFCRRAARQGQVGSCRFFLSLEDEVMDSLRGTINTDGTAYVESARLTAGIAEAQKALENQFNRNRPRYAVIRRMGMSA